MLQPPLHPCWARFWRRCLLCVPSPIGDVLSPKCIRILHFESRKCVKVRSASWQKWCHRTHRTAALSSQLAQHSGSQTVSSGGVHVFLSCTQICLNDHATFYDETPLSHQHECASGTEKSLMHHLKWELAPWHLCGWRHHSGQGRMLPLHPTNACFEEEKIAQQKACAPFLTLKPANVHRSIKCASSCIVLWFCEHEKEFPPLSWISHECCWQQTPESLHSIWVLQWVHQDKACLFACCGFVSLLKKT